MVEVLGIAQPFIGAIPEWQKFFDYLESLPKSSNVWDKKPAVMNRGLLQRLVHCTEGREEHVAKVQSILESSCQTILVFVV